VTLTLPYEVLLPRDREAPARARRLLSERFAPELADDELDTAKLLTSELVSNAVRHGDGTITLRAHLDEDRLLVEVIDQGSGFEHATRARSANELGRWGLHVVEAASSRWGVHSGTAHVWFELDRSAVHVAGGHAASDCG
jgi:anti-sigma regulatory factor (Ser/Thr protein kinase)